MNNNTNHLVIVITLLASMIMNVILLSMFNKQIDAAYTRGYDAGVDHVSNNPHMPTDAHDAYLQGLHEGQASADQTLYATCEDEYIASQYPDGFCEGVDLYLGL